MASLSDLLIYGIFLQKRSCMKPDPDPKGLFPIWIHPGLKGSVVDLQHYILVMF